MSRERTMAARMSDDEGSILPLTIFYGFLSLVLILLVVAASSLYIERKRLFTVADGAALAGAEAFTVDAVAATPTGIRPTLKTPDVAAAVAEYLEDNPRTEFESLHVDRAETVDGRSATVALSAYWRPPVVSLLVPQGFRIDVTALARSVFY
ncbi:pilus assembly protein TadG-related protein [Parafrigoribacterium soli]|uniref:pilus assembly protein TadG-related protein n=1 Tax=Parafrigoribacterium soli TaxID=3144663 RepID=UPI0032EE408C